MASSVTRAGAQARNKAFGPGSFQREPYGYEKGFRSQRLEHNEPRNLPGYAGHQLSGVYRGKSERTSRNPGAAYSRPNPTWA